MIALSNFLEVMMPRILRLHMKVLINYQKTNIIIMTNIRTPILTTTHTLIITHTPITTRTIHTGFVDGCMVMRGVGKLQGKCIGGKDVQEGLTVCTEVEDHMGAVECTEVVGRVVVAGRTEVVVHMEAVVVDTVAVVIGKEKNSLGELQQQKSWSLKSFILKEVDRSIETKIPSLYIQNRIDALGRAIEARFAPLVKFNLWLDSNGQGDWYQQLAIFLVKLPQRSVRNVISLLYKMVTITNEFGVAEYLFREITIPV